MASLGEHADLLWFMLLAASSSGIGLVLWMVKRELEDIGRKQTLMLNAIFGTTTTTGILTRLELVERECERNHNGWHTNVKRSSMAAAKE